MQPASYRSFRASINSEDQRTFQNWARGVSSFYAVLVCVLVAVGIVTGGRASAPESSAAARQLGSIIAARSDPPLAPKGSNR
jgi:cytochrome bd-type quinol oxidase subunit 2